MKGQHLPKGSRQSSNPVFIVIIALLLVVIAVLVFIIAKPGGEQSEQPQGGTEQNEPIEKLTDSIAMPGYSWLTLKADTTEQELALSNPPENFCQMRMSILLEDGTVIWTSELVQPGENSKPIVLSQPLAKGVYKNAKLKYECFTIDEAMTPLNGSQIAISLNVQ